LNENQSQVFKLTNEKTNKLQIASDPAVHHRFYKKQVKSTLANDPSTLEEYERQKQSMPESEFYPTADNLNYGKSAPIADEKKDKLVADLNSR